MKIIRGVVKTLAILLLITCAATFTAVYSLSETLPNSYMVTGDKPLEIMGKLPVLADGFDARSASAQSHQTAASGYDVSLKIFGIVPIKSAKVEVVDELYVATSGAPFGVKLYTSGVMVVGLSEVQTKDGKKNPADDAGIIKGDNIVTVDGSTVASNEAVAAVIERAGGRSVKVVLMREGEELVKTLTPVLCASEGVYKAGLWVRDSSAGIGTLTFYSPALDMVTGLGHGICDTDTGALLPLGGGEIVSAKIFDLQKSTPGVPGELKGRFLDDVIGTLMKNCEAGIYGSGGKYIIQENLVRIAMKQEVYTGEAQIITTIDAEGPKRYNCVIENVHFNNDNLTQNMIINVTDKNILTKSGGIVQGMSGSPIIQNGKLVGAITHVFVGDPTRGYGIFAETMYNMAIKVEEEYSNIAS